jgi:zinc/manganese transport system substrate-binding protein
MKRTLEESMKKMMRILWAAALGALAAVPAGADLKVATSLTDLASVAQYVGGKHVEAQSLCRGFEDPHFVPAKPSLMKAIQHADAFISVGLELDSGWLPLVLPGSRNPKIQPGAKGFIDASQGVDVLEKPSGTVSRAEGDVHPLGNPHYYADPKALEVVATHLAERFGSLDPANAAEYAANAKAFNAKMEAALEKWEKQMAPYKGAPIVSYHKNFIYFTNRFGLNMFGMVEPKPGIPPTPHHIQELAEDMKKSNVKVIVYEPYYKSDPSVQLAQRVGGTAVEVPLEAGGLPGTDDVFAKFDKLVSSVAGAYAGAGGKK